MSRGDELIESLRGANASSAADAAAIALLAEISNGYPVEQLTRLFQSSSPAAARASAWIASELGADALPLLDEISALLDNEARYVRFFAVDAVLSAATSDHGKLIAKAIDLIEDPDGAVRWKATQLLARASDMQLAAAVPYLRDERLRILTAWLNSDIGLAEISPRLADEDRTTRLFAAAAAVRSANRDRSALDLAAGAADEEVAAFAREELELLAIRRRG
jgi:hypothetical protein